MLIYHNTAALVALAVALRQLDGVKLPGPFRMSVARALRELQPVCEAYDVARLEVIAAHSGGAGTLDESAPGFAACMRDLQALGATVQPVTLPTVTEAQIAEHADDIPLSVLVSLLLWAELTHVAPAPG